VDFKGEELDAVIQQIMVKGTGGETEVEEEVDPVQHRLTEGEYQT